MQFFQLHQTTGWRLASGLAVVLCVSSWAKAEDSKAETKVADAKRYEQMVNRTLDYLSTKGQASDGSFSGQVGPSVTALVITGYLQNGRSINEPAVAKGLKYLEGFAQPDGGIHAKESLYKNYETSLGILAFAAANKDGRYNETLKKAEKFVTGLQWDGEEGHDPANPAYGGAGYGNKKRPDLSNTSFLIDALKAAGHGPDSEAMQKALIFISRCQNLESPHNTTPSAAKVNDGGFYYTPYGDGDSQAGKTENGGLRSYASMTYAGLKSMIFCGVKPDDPRVKAAFEWAQQNYDLKSNPGMGTSGLFYYYHTFAKALSTMGVDQMKDKEGKLHDWRHELLVELASRQNPDGSWTNKDARWLEGDPNLVSGYVLLTLSYLRQPTDK